MEHTGVEMHKHSRPSLDPTTLYRYQRVADEQNHRRHSAPTIYVPPNTHICFGMAPSCVPLSPGNACCDESRVQPTPGWDVKDIRAVP